jgi:hypothetical protein
MVIEKERWWSGRGDGGQEGPVVVIRKERPGQEEGASRSR